MYCRPFIGATSRPAAMDVRGQAVRDVLGQKCQGCAWLFRRQVLCFYPTNTPAMCAGPAMTDEAYADMCASWRVWTRWTRSCKRFSSEPQPQPLAVSAAAAEAVHPQPNR